MTSSMHKMMWSVINSPHAIYIKISTAILLIPSEYLLISIFIFTTLSFIVPPHLPPLDLRAHRSPRPRT